VGNFEHHLDIGTCPASENDIVPTAPHIYPIPTDGNTYAQSLHPNIYPHGVGVHVVESGRFPSEFRYSQQQSHVPNYLPSAPGELHNFESVDPPSYDEATAAS